MVLWIKFFIQFSSRRWLLKQLKFVIMAGEHLWLRNIYTALMKLSFILKYTNWSFNISIWSCLWYWILFTGKNCANEAIIRYHSRSSLCGIVSDGIIKYWFVLGCLLWNLFLKISNNNRLFKFVSCLNFI